jgi:hypothetical protein
MTQLAAIMLGMVLGYALAWSRLPAIELKPEIKIERFTPLVVRDDDPRAVIHHIADSEDICNASF